MIKFSIIILLVTIFCAAAYGAEKYDTKYDNVDLDEILKNDRLLNNYVNCLLSEGPCTPDGQELKGKKKND